MDIALFFINYYNQKKDCYYFVKVNFVLLPFLTARCFYNQLWWPLLAK